MVRMLSGTSIPGSVFLIGLLIVAAIDISYISINWGPFDSPEVVRSVTLHQEYYTMDNALDLAKLYLDTGLRYSIYQRMYDNGYRGGFSEIPTENLHNGNALWYDNKDSYPNEQALLENLKAPALANLGRYLEYDYVFLDNYEVKLPGYTGLDISKTSEAEILVKAAADKNLWIKRTMQNLDKIELEKNANLEENFGKGYLELYQKSLVKLESVKNNFTEIKALLESVRTGTLTREQEGSSPQVTELEVFQKALEDAGIAGAESREDGEAKLKAKLEEILNKLKDTPGETTVQFEKTLTLSVSEFSESEDCTKQESQRTEGDKTFYTTSMTCSFTYTYEFAVNVSVTDNSGKKYPVFDSEKDEISLEPLTLVFSAREKSEA